jgi:hypothetical protein
MWNYDFHPHELWYVRGFVKSGCVKHTAVGAAYEFLSIEDIGPGMRRLYFISTHQYEVWELASLAMWFRVGRKSCGLVWVVSNKWCATPNADALEVAMWLVHVTRVFTRWSDRTPILYRLEPLLCSFYKMQSNITSCNNDISPYS